MRVRDGRCGVTGCDVPADADGQWCARHASYNGRGCVECGRVEWRMRERVRHRRRLQWCRACADASDARQRAQWDRDRHRPIYSRCKAGALWFWVVRRAYADRSGAEGPIASGYAATEGDARTAAEAAAPDGVWWDAATAAREHRRQAAVRRAARASTATDGAPLAFVWCDVSWVDDYENTHRRVWAPHLVVRRTARFVFIEQDAWSEDRAAREAARSTVDRFAERRCYRLRRDELDRDGSTWCASARERFYSDVGRAVWEATREAMRREIPVGLRAAIDLLGLSWPCSVKDAAKAYRRMARTHHPDVGGDAAMFRQLRDALELLKRWAPREVA